MIYVDESLIWLSELTESLNTKDVIDDALHSLKILAILEKVH